MFKTKNRNWLVSAVLFVAVVSLCYLTITIKASATTVYVLDNQISVTDTANSCSVSNGKVTVTAAGGNFSASGTKNTITIKNESSEAKIISFDYTVSGGTNSFPSNSGKVAEVTLSGGASLQYTIQGGAWWAEAKVVLSNFSISEVAQSSNVSISYDETVGSVTCNGSTVSSGSIVQATSSGVALVATGKSGTSFLGWFDADTNQIISTAASYTLFPTADLSVRAAFATSTNAWFLVPDGKNAKNYLFDDLSEAGSFAQSINDKLVVLAANGTLQKGSYTIPSGVTLLIPFNSSNTLYTTTPGTTGGSFVTPTAYRTLTMASGANLTVNGSLSLSGTVSARKDYNGRPHGPLGYIKMNSGSSITINSGANLYAWGYIYGDGSVEVKSGATVYECFQVTDYRGGDVTSTMQNNKQKVFPMSQYYVQNIEVPMKLHVGAKENCFFAVDVSVVGVQTAVVPFVGGSGEKVMFQITNGYLGKSYDENTDRLVVDIYGDVTVAPYSFSIKVGLLGSVTMDSSKYVLPLTQNLTVNVKNGKTLTISQDIALLPEAELNIEQGANCTITDDKKIIVYDIDDWGGYCDTANKTHDVLPYAPGRPTPGTSVRESLTKDASILVNGTLDASKGYIYTTTHGANIYSTEAGEIRLRAGTEKIVYQVTTKSSDISGWPEIDITPAMLKNEDGKHVDTSSATAVTIYYHAHYDCECGDSAKHGVWFAGEHTAIADPEIAATCTTGGKTAGEHCSCSHVNVAQQDITALGHTEVTDEAVAPTCTETGLTEGCHCYRCNEVFTAQTEIPALGHDEVIDAAVAATCTETGLTEGCHCSVCNEVLTAQKVIDALGHTEVTDAAVAATCIATGLTEGCHCSVCNAVIKAQTEIPATGYHYWEFYSKNENDHTCQCKNCTDTVTLHVAYRLDDYLWFNGYVADGRFTGTNVISIQSSSGVKTAVSNGKRYFVKEIPADEIPNQLKFKVVSAKNGEVTFTVSLEDYQTGLGEEHKYYDLCDKLIKYGNAYVDYKDDDENLTSGTLAGNPFGENNTTLVVQSQFDPSQAVGGIRVITSGAKVYFDEALRLSVLYEMTGTLQGYTIVQIGLLVGDGASELTTEKFIAAYLAYDESQNKGNVDFVPNLPKDNGTLIQLNDNASFTNPSTIPTSGELTFDLTSLQYSQSLSLRPVFVLTDGTNYYCVYGRQVKYGLAEYINAKYADTKTTNEYRYLLETVWAVAEEAQEVFGG